MRLGPTLARFALLHLVAAPLVLGQDEPRQVPTFRAGVNAVLVDVLVLDPKGNPVEGLTRDDFTIEEDGVAQAITNFDVTDWTSYVAAETEGGPRPTEVNTYPRRFVFVVNRQGARFEYLNRAKRALTTFVVNEMADGDEAMVIDVGYSTKIVQQFQPAKEDTIQAIRGLSQMNIDYPMGPDRAAGQFYRDMESLGDSLAQLPGRKVIIVLSNELLTFSPPGSRTINASHSLKAAVESLNQANASVYTIDIRGPDSFGSSMYGGLSPLATETGGRYFRNNPTFEPPLHRIGTENQRYYLLSYVSTNAEADGSYRKITVRVSRPDVNVVARPGYFARPPAAEPTEEAASEPSPEGSGASRPSESAERAEPARPKASPDVSRELPLAVELTTYLLPTGRGTVRVPVVIALPADLLTGKGGTDRRLEVALQNDGGDVVASFQEPVSLERFFVMRNVELEPGSYLLKLTVRSEQQELYRASTRVDIPADFGDRFGLSSVVPVVSPEASASVGNNLPILPTASVKRGENLHLLFQVFAGREEPVESVRVSYRVLDDDGKQLSEGQVKDEMALSDRPEGTPVILSVPTRDLPYGRLRVEVRVEDAFRGKGASSDLEFRVR